MYSCRRPGTERHERPNYFRVVARRGCLGPRHTDESSAINDGGVPLGRLSTDDTNDSADEFWAVLEAETGYSSYVDYLKAYKKTSTTMSEEVTVGLNCSLQRCFQLSTAQIHHTRSIN